MLQCVVGALASVLAFLIGFVPPSQFSSSNPLVYALLILAGILVLGLLPPALLYRLRKPSWKDPALAATLAPAAAAIPAQRADDLPAPAAGDASAG